MNHLLLLVALCGAMLRAVSVSACGPPPENSPNQPIRDNRYRGGIRGSFGFNGGIVREKRNVKPPSGDEDSSNYSIDYKTDGMKNDERPRSDMRYADEEFDGKGDDRKKPSRDESKGDTHEQPKRQSEKYDNKNSNGVDESAKESHDHQEVERDPKHKPVGSSGGSSKSKITDKREEVLETLKWRARRSLTDLKSKKETSSKIKEDKSVKEKYNEETYDSKQETQSKIKKEQENEMKSKTYSRTNHAEENQEKTKEDYQTKENTKDNSKDCNECNNEKKETYYEEESYANTRKH